MPSLPPLDANFWMNLLADSILVGFALDKATGVLNNQIKVALANPVISELVSQAVLVYNDYKEDEQLDKEWLKQQLFAAVETFIKRIR